MPLFPTVSLPFVGMPLPFVKGHENYVENTGLLRGPPYATQSPLPDIVMAVTIQIPPAESDYVDAVVHRLVGLFGDELAVVYPTGSLALDGYTPGRSDIDLIAVVATPPPVSLLRAVAAGLSHDVLPCPATGLEFVLYAREALTGVDVTAGYALDLNTGRELPPKVSLDPGDGPRFWYAIDRSMTYQANLTLHGPPPHELLAPVPFDVLLPVVIESLEGHRSAVSVHGDNAVLNGARALRFGFERRWYAKPAAAEWARDEAPEFADLITAAIASHAVGRSAGHGLPADRVTAFLDHVLSQLRPA